MVITDLAFGVGNTKVCCVCFFRWKLRGYFWRCSLGGRCVLCKYNKLNPIFLFLSEPNSLGLGCLVNSRHKTAQFWAHIFLQFPHLSRLFELPWHLTHLLVFLKEGLEFKTCLLASHKILGSKSASKPNWCICLMIKNNYYRTSIISSNSILSKK